MAEIKNYGIVGIGQDVQFGKNKARIKVTSGYFEVKDSDNLNLINLRVANGIDNSDVVNLSQLNSAIAAISGGGGGSNVSNLSANWENTWLNVQANSANWASPSIPHSVNKTSSYELTDADMKSNTIFTNYGASGLITFTFSRSVEDDDCVSFLAKSTTYEVPPEYSLNYVKSTSIRSSDYEAFYTFDISNLAIGNCDVPSTGARAWEATLGTTTNQRVHVDLGSATIIAKVHYINFHLNGIYSNSGVKDFTFWGSNVSGAFAELTYGVDTDWTPLSASISAMIQHSGVNEEDEHFFTVDNSIPYRYYAFKIANSFDGAVVVGWRRIKMFNNSGVLIQPFVGNSIIVVAESGETIQNTERGDRIDLRGVSSSEWSPMIFPNVSNWIPVL